MSDNIQGLINAKNDIVRISAIAVQLKKLYEQAPSSKEEFNKLTAELVNKGKSVLAAMDKAQRNS